MINNIFPTSNHTNRFALISAMVLVWLLVICFTPLTAAQELKPALSPDSDSTPVGLLNTSDTTQQKAGSLMIGYAGLTTPSKLCLNASGVNDANNNCISSWGDLVALAGSYINLSQTSFFTTDLPTSLLNASRISNYTLQNKYAYLKPGPNQAFGAIVKSPDLPLCHFTDPQDDYGECVNIEGVQGCSEDSDCGNYVTTAIYGSNSDNPANYAAYLAGRVDITYSLDRRGNGDRLPGRICLNGTVPIYNDQPTAADKCISSWNDIAASAQQPLYVKLQSSTIRTLMAQTDYGAAITGNASFGSAVVGDAICLPTAATCGDGVCQRDIIGCAAGAGETDVTCPVDCKVLDMPVITVALDVTATPQNMKMKLTIKPGGPLVNPIPKVNIIVVRSTSSTPYFQPTNGLTYTVGQKFGSDTIVYSGILWQGWPIATVAYDVITPPVAGITYYYRAYQGNDYPAWSVATTPVSTTPVQLDVNVVAPSQLLLVRSVAQDRRIICSCIGSDCLPCNLPGCVIGTEINNCSALYDKNALITLERTNPLSTPYVFCSWSSCPDPLATQCQIVMSSNKSIQAVFGAGSCRLEIDFGTE